MMCVQHANIYLSLHCPTQSQYCPPGRILCIRCPLLDAPQCLDQRPAMSRPDHGAQILPLGQCWQGQWKREEEEEEEEGINVWACAMSAISPGVKGGPLISPHHL